MGAFPLTRRLSVVIEAAHRPAGLLHAAIMHIVLFRYGTRALFLRADKLLIDCPPHVRLWLGGPVTEHCTSLTLDTPMPGIHPSTVLREILEHGFCALDEYGVVHSFSTPHPLRRDARPNFGRDEEGVLVNPQA